MKFSMPAVATPCRWRNSSHRPLVAGFVETQGNNPKSPPGQSPGQLDLVGKQFLARLAPSGPEIDQHHAAALLPQHFLIAGRIDRLHGHRLLRRLACTAGESRQRNQQSESYHH